jgi:hypothetical protein
MSVISMLSDLTSERTLPVRILSDAIVGSPDHR